MPYAIRTKPAPLLAKDIQFPELLAPVDDLPPATLITKIQSEGDKRQVRTHRA